jgi:hypothetical protein
MKPSTPDDGVANLLANLTEKQMVETIYSALRKRGVDWVLAVSELLPNGKSRLDLLSLTIPRHTQTGGPMTP